MKFILVVIRKGEDVSYELYFKMRRKLSNVNDFMFLISLFRVSNFIMSEMAVVIEDYIYVNSVIMQKCVQSAVFV